MSNPTHVRPTVVPNGDGKFAAGIVMSDGHTVRLEFRHVSYEGAEAEAKEFFERETAVAVPVKNGSKKKAAAPAVENSGAGESS